MRFLYLIGFSSIAACAQSTPSPQCKAAAYYASLAGRCEFDVSERSFGESKNCLEAAEARHVYEKTQMSAVLVFPNEPCLSDSSYARYWIAETAYWRAVATEGVRDSKQLTSYEDPDFVRELNVKLGKPYRERALNKDQIRAD